MERSQEKGRINSVNNAPNALFGKCLPEQLPIIGSMSRGHIVRAAAAAGVPTPSYSTDYVLDFSKGYIGTAACVVLCEALLTYTPSEATEATAAPEEDVSCIPRSPHPHVVYCALKELRMPNCGLDTGSAYALFKLLTHDRCAFTLKLLDIRHNPYLALEAGQLLLRALGYVVRDADGSGGEVAGAELLALLRAFAGTDISSAIVPHLVEDSLANDKAGGAHQESHTATVPIPRTFDMGTQTGNVAPPAMSDGGLPNNTCEDGEAQRSASADTMNPSASFRSRPAAPNRNISRLCTLHAEGTNIPPHYLRRLEVLCEQNRHL